MVGDFFFKFCCLRTLFHLFQNFAVGIHTKKNQEKRAKLYDRHGQRIKMIDELISLSIIGKNESQKKSRGVALQCSGPFNLQPLF